MRYTAPVQDILEYEDVQFDNAFWKTSPYKGRPTPDLEAKWKDLWYCKLHERALVYFHDSY